MGDEAERLKIQDDLRILTLEGSGYEMGRQHGEALREEIHQGVLPFFGNFTEFDSKLRKLPEANRRAVAAQLDREIFDPLRRFVPQVYLDELRGIAEGSGLPADVVLRGNFLSELLQVSLKQQAPSEGAPAGGGCTGFAVAGPATRDGELLHGKNTDYQGIGVWNRFPVLILSKPADGFAYVRSTSAGLIKCNTDAAACPFDSGAGAERARRGVAPARIRVRPRRGARGSPGRLPARARVTRWGGRADPCGQPPGPALRAPASRGALPQGRCRSSHGELCTSLRLGVIPPG